MGFYELKERAERCLDYFFNLGNIVFPHTSHCFSGYEEESYQREFEWQGIEILGRKKSSTDKLNQGQRFGVSLVCRFVKAITFRRCVVGRLFLHVPR